jgi:Na+/melibiose symporter-like transporter
VALVRLWKGDSMDLLDIILPIVGWIVSVLMIGTLIWCYFDIKRERREDNQTELETMADELIRSKRQAKAKIAYIYEDSKPIR